MDQQHSIEASGIWIHLECLLSDSKPDQGLRKKKLAYHSYWQKFLWTGATMLAQYEIDKYYDLELLFSFIYF